MPQNNYPYNAEAVYLLHMISAVLNDKPLQPPKQQLNWSVMLKLAVKHQVEVLMYYGVTKLPQESRPPADVFAKLLQYFQISVARDAAQQAEVITILDTLEQEKIDAAILKGFFTKDFYPSPEMRQMCDLDFLVRNHQDRDKMDEIMPEKLSYTIVYRDKGMYGEYVKKPFLYVDFTDCLIPSNYPAHKYFADVWSRMIKRDGYAHSYQMNPQDFYIYMLAHTAKHYISGGIGLRYCMDLYVFHKKFPDIIKDESVKKALISLGLYDFRKKLTDLSVQWFADPNAKIATDDVFAYIMRCGVYGRKDVKNANQYLKNRGGKAGFFFKKLFPSATYMKNTFHFLYKVPFLIPIMWVVNWFRILFIHPDKIAKTVHDSNDVNMQLVAEADRINQKMGIALKDNFVRN